MKSHLLRPILVTLALVLPSFSVSARAAESGLKRTPAPKNAEVYFISPKNKAKVKNPIKVQFGLKGMGVAPAGVEKAKTGHHHLIIDKALPQTDLPIPADKNYVHFGGGQTETEITLPPGKHTLQLLLGDKNHIPHNPPIQSKVITIYVKK